MTTPGDVLPHSTRRSPVLWVGLVFAIVLVGTIVFTFAGRRESPFQERIHQDIAVLEEALTRYQADGNPLPEEGDLATLLVPKYLPSLPVDPWGRPYRYMSNGDRVFLSTFGKSDMRGGNLEEQDHTNHDGHGKTRVK